MTVYTTNKSQGAELLDLQPCWNFQGSEIKKECGRTVFPLTTRQQSKKPALLRISGLTGAWLELLQQVCYFPPLLILSQPLQAMETVCTTTQHQDEFSAMESLELL